MSSHRDGDDLPEIFLPFYLEQGLVVTDAPKGEVSEQTAGHSDPKKKQNEGVSTDVSGVLHSNVSHAPEIWGILRATVVGLSVYLEQFLGVRSP